jgi:hypothetical protein
MMAEREEREKGSSWPEEQVADAVLFKQAQMSVLLMRSLSKAT